MNTHNKTVLTCIDGSPLTHAVCDYAAWVASRVGAPLTLLHTIDHHPETAHTTDFTGNIGIDSRDHLMDELTLLEQQRSKLRLQQGKDLLHSAKQRVAVAGIDDPIINQRHGSLVESLIELEDELRVLVIGVRGKEHEKQPDKIGAKLESIIRSLHKPILVVNADFKAPEQVMIAYDGSKAAEKAVEMVATSPLYQGLTCHLLCANKNDESTAQQLKSAADKLNQSGKIKVIAKILPGKPELVLCEYQQQNNIDMTIMGAFSHTRIHDWLLGSFTVKMLTHSHKPLLLLR